MVTKLVRHSRNSKNKNQKQSTKRTFLKSNIELAGNKNYIKIQKGGWYCDQGLGFDDDGERLPEFDDFCYRQYYQFQFSDLLFDITEWVEDDEDAPHYYGDINAQGMTLRDVILQFVQDNYQLLDDNDLRVDDDGMPENWFICQIHDDDDDIEMPYTDDDLDRDMYEIFEDLDLTFRIVRVDDDDEDSIIEGDLNNYGHGYEHSGW